MNRIIKVTLIALIGMLIMPVSVFAKKEENIKTSNEVNIFPVKGIFYAQNISSKNFKELIAKERSYFVNLFLKEFNENFPNFKKDINEKDKYKTFVSYLNIPKVSEEKFKRNDHQIQYTLPMTTSINFVNSLTGETLFAKSLNVNAKYNTTFEEIANGVANKDIKDLYKQIYEYLAKNVVAKAAQEFRPFDVNVEIIDKYKNLYILNKGLSAGVAKGDLLTDEEGNQLSVIYSSLDYSAATLLIGKAKKSNVFSKYTTLSLSQIKKPKILFVNDFKDESLYNFFSSKVGSGADFGLINVDRTFFDLKTALVADSSLKGSTFENREAPDYFLKLHLLKPSHTKYVTDGTFDKYSDRYDGLVCSSVFDKTGKIAYSKCVEDYILNNNIGDVKLDDASQLENVMANAISKLATFFANDIKFEDSQLIVLKEKDGVLEVNDKNGLLNIGSPVVVYKKVKSDGGKDYIVPIWNYTVANNVDSVAILTPMYPIVENLGFPSKKDIIITNTIVRANSQVKLFNFDINNLELAGNMLELKNFKDIAFYTLASSMKSPISINKDDFKKQLDELNGGYGFKRKLEMPKTKDNLTIRVSYKIIPLILLEKDRQSLLDKKKYDIFLKIESKNNDEIINSEIKFQTVEFVVPKEKSEDVIQFELLKAVSSMIEQIGSKF